MSGLHQGIGLIGAIAHIHIGAFKAELLLNGTGKREALFKVGISGRAIGKVNFGNAVKASKAAG
ncbi:hypothetical protein [Alteromonas sp. a30]|uniref:hypothetical protein n=1 Tax=Alteromonas sp. a30 TaxID=2730917 RepID=UPI00227F8C7B|nr:hypothetical protein [Alteromonas sp. a30]MCY7297461.1 hypothetical protein [Alteromonas sp. a30]